MAFGALQAGMTGLLHMHHADGLVRLQAASLVLERAAFCFWFQRRGEVEPVHQATSTDGPANACTSHASDCELNEWLEFRTLNENMSAFPCEIIQDLECTIDWAEYREDALY